jgi:acyl-CoA synthetase (AMP-forming)/AMP-acid ligase II
MTCYYGNEKATKETVDSEGWLDTGDAGYIDDDGFVYISDRIKDIIIRGGENIPSTEIENAVFTDSRVQEAAAVPIPDDMLGELVGVAVCLRPGAKATGDELIATISPKLRFPARPAFIWVSEAPLDRNANGKVVKKDIKDKVVAMYKKRKQGKL